MGMLIHISKTICSSCKADKRLQVNHYKVLLWFIPNGYYTRSHKSSFVAAIGDIAMHRASCVRSLQRSAQGPDDKLKYRKHERMLIPKLETIRINIDSTFRI